MGKVEWFEVFSSTFHLFSCYFSVFSAGLTAAVVYICVRMTLKTNRYDPHRTRFWTLMLLALVFQHCASRQTPPGGPEDKTPPAVVRLFPPKDTTGITSLAYLEIEFDEPVDRNSLNNQIGMMPELPNGFKLNWKGGRRLRILLTDSLEKDLTYIINIGTGVKDYRGNRLTSPILLTFSTGKAIDRGEIRGRVTGESIQDVFIYAYPVDSTFHSGMIFEQKPRYYTQVDQQGNYRISYLRPGVYRLFALKDQNRNRVYTLQIDQIGFPAGDVRLDSLDSHIDNLNFTMTQEDTLQPKIAAARSKHNHLVEVTFSEAVQFKPMPAVSINDSILQTPVLILAREILPEAPNVMRVFTDSMSEGVYHGSVSRVMDNFGNAQPDSANHFRFTAKTREDTVVVRLKRVTPADGAQGVSYDAELQLLFSHPVDSLTLGEHAVLLDPDSQQVAGKWGFQVPSQPVFHPDNALAAGAGYHLQIDLAEIRSVFQKSFGDSSRAIHFVTREISDEGEIGGTIAVQGDYPQAIVEVVNLQNRSAVQRVVPTGQPYLIPHIPEGQYRLSAVLDINGNGKQDLGQSNPFQFAEPSLLYADTIRVRKRWTTDGINFLFTQ